MTRHGTPGHTAWIGLGSNLGDRASHLQFNYYEPRAQTRELLQDPHEDGLYFTLWRADAPGLEIQAPDGSWHPVRLGPGELLEGRCRVRHDDQRTGVRRSIDRIGANDCSRCTAPDGILDEQDAVGALTR